MDGATFLGIAIALVGVVGGALIDGGQLDQLAQPAAAFIVLGGTLGAVLVSYSFDALGEALRSTAAIFFRRPPSIDSVIEEILGFASRARREGVMVLERHARFASDSFLRQGLGLVADGHEAATVRNVLDLKLRALEERLERAPAVLETAGGYAPTLGILGAVLGLVQVLQRLDGVDAVRSGIATAFVATLYGVALANLLLLPLATKLRERHREELLLKTIMLEGVVSIREGKAPTLIADKLRSFDEREGREAA